MADLRETGVNFFAFGGAAYNDGDESETEHSGLGAAPAAKIPEDARTIGQKPLDKSARRPSNRRQVVVQEKVMQPA
ncbi:hypothetical protein A2773_06685 [Candidatus Gottesmanbacteria bacterium RIFCSPHIGHO2_01_FULL_39_10]|uniref:Uncharacterized protein n=1 Tax=Candidatus Gottesmanbacteria bacterium RIFCSPHIGHO2_01_FULL_39_10 TaxID=1798375 RepID=A0A1F5ZPK3_9BACT|nr:MAG: hypothetical protein A2773_06685 [Candidatus Gottesmanbacteria bacterium RIFCSPHIGHO2_01_FULL_39_10]